MMFLVRFLLFFGAFSCGGLYANLWSYPLSVRAFWQGAIDSSNTSLLDEMQQGTAIVNKIYIYIYCLLSNQSCLEASKTSLGFSGFYGKHGYNSIGKCFLFTLSSQRYLVLSEVCFISFSVFLNHHEKLDV